MLKPNKPRVSALVGHLPEKQLYFGPFMQASLYSKIK